MTEVEGRVYKINLKQILFLNLLLPLIFFVIFIGIEYYGDVRDQNLRSDLRIRGLRTSGFVERFSGKGEQFAEFRFHIPDGRDIETRYDMTGAPERSRIYPSSRIDVVYDPASPKRAIPEPFSSIPPFDIASHLRIYFLAGGIFTIFISSLSLFRVWRDNPLGRD